MNEHLIKTGYMRIVNRSNIVQYISFKEFLSYADSTRMFFKSKYDSGEISVYCACSSTNDLELSITENGVVRVKSNHQQEKHLPACPKSKHYQNWLNKHKNGNFLVDETGSMIFNITMPGVIKSASTRSGGSSESSVSSLAHTTLLSMITTLNAVAWEKQTYIKKKEISIENKEGRPHTWTYKNRPDFIRLIFGVSNDVLVKNGQNVFPFYELCYRKDTYFSCNDFKRRFFIYAQVSKLAVFKEERKYQYVTLEMPSDKSSKTTVRIKTEEYLNMIENVDVSHIQDYVLSGYVYRSHFEDSDWMTFIKGFFCLVSDNGLYSENDYIASVFNYFSKMQVIFKRCYQPISCYGEYIPTMIIENIRGKSVLIDLVDTKQKRSKRSAFVNDNPEFHIITALYEQFSPEELYIMVKKLLCVEY